MYKYMNRPTVSVKGDVIARLRVGDKHIVRVFNGIEHKARLIYDNDSIKLIVKVWREKYGLCGRGPAELDIAEGNYGIGNGHGFYDKDIVSGRVGDRTVVGRLRYDMDANLRGRYPWTVITDDGECIPMRDLSRTRRLGTLLSDDPPFPAFASSAHGKAEETSLRSHTRTEAEDATEDVAEMEITAPADSADVERAENISAFDGLPAPEFLEDTADEDSCSGADAGRPESEKKLAESTVTPAKENSGTGEYVIYTDGSSLSNPGPCGAAYVMLLNGHLIGKRLIPIGAGTNNIAELTAVIEALKDVQTMNPAKVTIISDSQYVVKGATEWYKSWVANDWVSSSGSEVQNVELWKSLIEEKKSVNADFRWVRGHDGDRYNEMCDQLAKDAAAQTVSCEEC